MKFKKLFLCIILNFVGFWVKGGLLEVRQADKVVDVKPFAELAFSQKGGVNISTLNFSPFSLNDVVREKGVNFLKFKLKNSTTESQLYINTAYFDSVGVFVETKDTWQESKQQSGFLVPMDAKVVKNARTTLVPIPILQGATKNVIIALYSKTKTSALAADVSAKIGLQLYTKHGLSVFKTHKYMAFLVSGVLLFMMIINASIFYLGKRKSYLYLVFYNLFFLLAIVSTNGLMQELGLLNETEIGRTFRLVMWNTLPIFYLLFGRQYLQLKRKSKAGYHLVNALVVLNILALIPFGFANLSLVFKLSPYLLPFNALVLFILAMQLTKQKFVPAKFMLVASGLLFLGYLFIFIGVKFNWILFVYSDFVFVLALLLELSVFSIAVFADLRYVERKSVEELEKRLLVEQDLNRKNRELISVNLQLMNNTQRLDKIMENKVDDFSKIKQEVGLLQTDNKYWSNTFKHFQEVHPTFFEELLKSFPKLTSNDLKLCAFLKMNLTTKEIASINGVTEVAVSKSRNRLRKKLNMPPGEDILAFIHKNSHSKGNV